MSGLVGVLGGTFDPVHAGHLALASAAMNRLGLERVHFLVAPLPPHKEGRVRTSPAHRFAMVALATADRPEFVPDPLDLEVAGPCYTVDSLPRFRSAHKLPPDGAVFLAGGDSLRDFHLWKDGQTLAERERFAFFVRKGVEVPPEGLTLPGGRAVLDLRGASSADLPRSGACLLDADLPEVSSTALRNMLQCGVAAPPGLPGAVMRYIQKTRVYTNR
ncbi:MAG: nicotinate (nicotinamide) nucleotide adenylyltransferase [Acidobacteria bacterium]|nr:nicotinate (nicotinamide) nucleotide adenylyltransferase [Acidobacteriota bacterium]